ncbi:MAG TPA: hypothetical protein VG676_01430 [Chitinophagaceae bacterium]|jgi:hypothetical protein|nr:hypothetical protein [Chitinophagaceae bacterium]
MKKFSAGNYIIGINPYAIPPAVMKQLPEQTGREKVPILVSGKLNGHLFLHTLVK